ncbi:hypothetical protein LUZ63_020956 [Rhynchospora breviuscula]|uniref:Bacterial sugar transferase domain-containing protein n=1 Tax=Rhynchospora breviuscula TaxID=2022672 RepID=A0A9P9Z8S2_9POAL|nr:hypothetical protein LUZ63_020956 [Rhynchospora breviuscula]
MALDVVVVVAALTLAAQLRESLPFDRDSTDLGERVVVLAPLFLGVWIGVLALLGTYRTHRFDAGTEVYKSVLSASVLTAGCIAIALYLGKVPLSRGFFVLSFAVGAPALVVGRLLLRRLLHRLRTRGHLRHRVLIAGDPAHVDDLARVLRREPWLGYEIVGALTPEDGLLERDRTEGAVVRTPSGIPYVGSAERASEVATADAADSLIIAGGTYSSATALRRAQWALEEHRVQVIVAPDVTDVAAERVAVRPVAGLPLVHLEPPTGQKALRSAKRTFDVVAAATLLLLLSPLMLLAAWRVRSHDGGPVLFRQERVGQDGRPFPMLKFRSMVVDAEERLAELARSRSADGTGTRAAGNVVLFKMCEDPRVTPPGRWLRRFSVDELPQLLNVLRGEMSLVGPRPALASEVDRYDKDVTRRLRVRPGITGLWQVSGRSDLSWEETVRLDLYYVDNWSMVQDLLILLRTVRAVTRSSGAY